MVQEITIREKYTIPSYAKRPIAKQVIKETLDKYDIQVWEFFSDHWGARRNKLLAQATREICGRLRYEHNYPMALIGKCLNRDRSSIAYHLKLYQEDQRNHQAMRTGYARNSEPNERI